jgi:RNA polymerase sigma-70 factor, ECF subfamily
MNEQERYDLFAELITRHQGQIYGFIYAVVRNREDTEDLFQAVSLVLWNKFDSFRLGSNFLAWARQIARNKIGHFVKRKHLPIYVAEDLLDILMQGSTTRGSDQAEAYLAGLQRCRENLAATDQQLLQLRYVEGLSTVEIAERTQRLQQSVSRSLNRIRRWLLECIRMELVRQGRPAEDPS